TPTTRSSSPPGRSGTTTSSWRRWDGGFEHAIVPAAGPRLSRRRPTGRLYIGGEIAAIPVRDNTSRDHCRDAPWGVSAVADPRPHPRCSGAPRPPRSRRRPPRPHPAPGQGGEGAGAGERRAPDGGLLRAGEPARGEGAGEAVRDGH